MKQRRVFPQLPDSTAAYLAGLFDGEGCIGIRYGRDHGILGWTALVQITSSSEDGFLHKLYEECTRPGNFTSIKLRNRRPAHRWVMVGRAMDWFLATTLPYLRLKREQADVAVAFRDDMRRQRGRAQPLTPRQHAYRQLLKLLLDKLHLDTSSGSASRWAPPGSAPFRRAVQVATDTTKLVHWLLFTEEQRQAARARWTSEATPFPFYEVAAP